MATSLLALSAVGLGSLVLTSTSAAADSPATLLAEYTFDTVTTNGANVSTVSDDTGGGHVLTLSGAWSVTNGVSTPAVSFQPISMGNSPHTSDLNPGTREFAVTTVFKLPGDSSALPDTPNIVQKGFFSDAGQWKMQLKPGPGLIQCRFKGSLGAKLVSSSRLGVDDGAWHTSTCWRSGNVLGVTVDGVTDQVTANVGSIASTRPLRVGAKSLTATTDQFSGTLDYVAVAIGDGAAVRSRASAPTVP